MTNFVNPSEEIGCQRIEQSFKLLFPEMRLLHNIILPMELEGHVKSAEYDAIVICTAGVYTFEIKGQQKGHITAFKDDNGIRFWEHHTEFGVKNIPDPIVQGSIKQRYLYDSIKCLSRYYVYFPSNDITIDPKLPFTIIGNNELNSIPRVIKNEAKKRKKLITIEDVEMIAESIIELSKGMTPEIHHRNCADFHAKDKVIT